MLHNYKPGGNKILNGAVDRAGGFENEEGSINAACDKNGMKWQGCEILRSRSDKKSRVILQPSLGPILDAHFRSSSPFNPCAAEIIKEYARSL